MKMNIFKQKFYLTFLAVFLVLKTENFHRTPEIENIGDFDENWSTGDIIEALYEIGKLVSDWSKFYFIFDSNVLIGKIGNWQITYEFEEAFEKFNILRFFEFFYYFLIILQVLAKLVQRLRKNRMSKRFRTNRKFYFITNVDQMFKTTNRR